MDLHVVVFFVMEILSPHWGNIGIDIQIGDYLTDVYLKGGL
jgi:hypothetical protein